jgi:hypothetical protein
MLLRNILKGEHFVVDGDTLYRKTEDGYEVVLGVDEEPDLNTDVRQTNPMMWFSDNMKKPGQRKYL